MMTTTRIQKRARLTTFPRVHCRVPEIVVVFAIAGRAAVVVAILRLLYPHQSAVHDDQKGDAKEDDDAGGRSAAQPLLVDHRLAGVDGEANGVERRTLQYEDDVEDAERVQRAEDERDQESRLEQRQRDLPELLPFVGAIHGRCFIDVAWNDL